MCVCVCVYVYRFLESSVYMLVEVNFSNPKLLAYAMKIRTPKLIVMLNDLQKSA